VVVLYPWVNLPAYFVVDWMGNNCTCKLSTIITFLNEFTLIVYAVTEAGTYNIYIHAMVMRLSATLILARCHCSEDS